MPRDWRRFGGINLLLEVAKKQIASLNRNQVATWLANQEAYALHKVPRKDFKRNKVIVADVDTQWQAGLVGMQQFSKYYDSVKYILTLIDIIQASLSCWPNRQKGFWSNQGL